MNPLIGTDEHETVTSVRNVLQFMAGHQLEGENTAEIADGRRLILECCSDALETVLTQP
jgi:hypothetical protein